MWIWVEDDEPACTAGLSAVANGYLSAARADFLKAMSSRLVAHDRRGVARQWMNLAGVDFRLVRTEDAFASLLRASALYEVLDDQEGADAVLRNLEHLPQTRGPDASMKRPVRVRRTELAMLGWPSSESASELMEMRARLAEIDVHVLKEIREVEEAGPDAAAWMLLKVGQLATNALLSGDLVSAELYFNRVRSLRRELGSSETGVLLDLGRVRWALGDSIGARELLTEAVATCSPREAKRVHKTIQQIEAIRHL